MRAARIVSGIEIATMIAAILTVLLACLVPIYTDEVNWLLLRSRYFLDGGNTILFNLVSCTDTFAAPPPWFMVPFRAANAWLYDGLEDPLRIRLTSVATMVAVFGILLYLLRHAFPPRFGTLRLTAVMAAFATLGVMPFLLVLDRPEQHLLAGCGLLMFLPLARDEQRSGCSAAAVTGFVVSLAMFSIHPKALFFLPLMVISIWYLVPAGTLAVAAIGLLSAAAWVSFLDWEGRLACPNDGYIRALQEQTNLSPALLAHPGEFLARLIRNETGMYHPLSYFSSILFRDHYMSDWLPPGLSGGSWPGLLNLLLLALFGLLGVTFLAALLALVSEAWRRRRMPAELALVLALLASLASLAIFQAVKNVYEATLVVPLFGLAVMLVVHDRRGRNWRRIRTIGGSVLLVISLVSQVTLWSLFAPSAIAEWTKGGYLPNQRYSYSPFHYDRARSEILDTSRRCGIERDGRMSHLVVDEFTYPMFANTREPFLIGYISGGYGHGISNLERLLIERRSAGVIVGCLHLPPELRSAAVQNGDFCCLPAFRP